MHTRYVISPWFAYIPIVVHLSMLLFTGLLLVDREG